MRRAELEGELAAERRQAELFAREQAERRGRVSRLRAQHAADSALLPLAARLAAALKHAGETVNQQVAALEQELGRDHAAGQEMAGELRACASEEAEIHARLRGAGELVTDAEVAAQRLRDQAAEAELTERYRRAARAPRAGARRGALGGADAGVLDRVERLQRRREQLARSIHWRRRSTPRRWPMSRRWRAAGGPRDGLARAARGHPRHRPPDTGDLPGDFQAAARNFEELAGDVFPGGTGRLGLVSEERAHRGARR